METATADNQVRFSDESYIAKLTIKAIGCKPQAVTALPDGEDKVALCRVYGNVQDVRVKESSTIAGSFETEFKGNFEAVNMQTGEVFRSGRMYLPKGISDVLEQGFKAITKDDATASTEFGFEIRAIKASNPIGYSYEAQALQKAAKVDELASLRKAIMALPASGVKVPNVPALTSGKGKK